MQQVLIVTFFTSVLSDLAIPEFSSHSPYLVDLLFEGQDDPIGVEFLEIVLQATGSTSVQIAFRTIGSSSDGLVLPEGAAFFVMRGAKLIAKGSVVSS